MRNREGLALLTSLRGEDFEAETCFVTPAASKNISVKGDVMGSGDWLDLMSGSEGPFGKRCLSLSQCLSSEEYVLVHGIQFT